MSIASGNVFARNIYQYYFVNKTKYYEDRDPRYAGRAAYEELTAARLLSLVMQVIAVGLVLACIELRLMQDLVSFQLLGNIFILQKTGRESPLASARG